MQKHVLSVLIALSLTCVTKTTENFYNLVSVSQKDPKTVFHELINGPKAVLVDFFAHWCPACRAVEKTFEKISHDAQYKNTVRFIKVNYDDFSKLCDTENVRNLPHFGFYKNGIKVHALTGKKTEAELQNAIQKYLL